MATTQRQQETELQIKRTFAAPRERVFRAWIDAKEMAVWFHPGADYSTIITQLDPKTGGKYSVQMHHKDGNVHRLSGTYRQVTPPEKLVFTWRWDNDPPGQESLVSLEFLDLGNETEIRLVHGQLPNAESRDKHNHGWNGCLDQLTQYLA